MGQAILLVLLSIVHKINDVFAFIFPLFPPIGLIICGLGFLFLVVYAFKSGLGSAIKISLGLVIILIILTYFIGKILKLFLVVGNV